MLLFTFTLKRQVTRRTDKPTRYLTLLSADLGQVNIQQYSENLERALPTNSNILEKEQGSLLFR